MGTAPIRFEKLPQAEFGVVADLTNLPPHLSVDTFISSSDQLLDQFANARGLMVVRGLSQISQDPTLLVQVSKVFGEEVENYHQTLTAQRFFHADVAEILVLSNLPPCNHPPPPRPSIADGLPIRFPHQPNWHTDQSYRRPPPDVTLLYAVKTPPSYQGQTLFADCTAAFAALDPDTQDLIRHLSGIHAPSWIGRTCDDVRAGVGPRPLLPHQQPQHHPLVRYHPDTGEPALYICEEKQMDFVDGPIAGLEPGPDGEGARLLRDLLHHATRREFVYVHEWQPGDLVIGDNRCLLHAATWYDADAYDRIMWRTTVMGNPGLEYQGEAKSWIPQDGHDVMHGMEDA